MRKVAVEALISDREPCEVYENLADFGHYETNVDDVVSIEVETDPDGKVVSHWVVKFRNGLLRWTEEDWFDKENLQMGFVQSKGDFETFGGRWSISPHSSQVLVRLDIEFDFGIPSLASIVDPVAERVLHDRTNHTLAQLFGSTATVSRGGEPLVGHGASRRQQGGES